MSEYIIAIRDEPEEDGCYRLTKPAEEIVRCGDCRYYEDTGNCNWFECSSCWMLAEVTPDGFCAWGERRES